MVEEKFKNGDISLSKKYLLPEASVHVTSSTLQMPQLIHEAHIFMVDLVSDPDAKATSLQSGEDRNDDDQDPPQNWRQIIKEKDEEIALLKTHIEGLGELILELISQNEELKKAVPPTSTTVTSKSAKQKGKGKVTMKGAPEPAKSTNHQLSFEERKCRVYSFERRAVKPLFYMMLEDGLQLPEPKRPNQIHKVDSPDYCPYHRCLGHIIEDCFIFKDLLEDKHQKNEVHIPKGYLLSKIEPIPAKNIMGAQPLVTSQRATQLDYRVPVRICCSDSESSGEENILYKPPTTAKNQNNTKQDASNSSKATDGHSDVNSHGGACSSLEPTT